MSEDWLEHLERTVHEATETIGTLRRQNQDLADQVETLEEELAQARDAREARESGSGDGGDGAAHEAAAAAWRDERQEIRRRVESLTEKLSGLLE